MVVIRRMGRILARRLVSFDEREMHQVEMYRILGMWRGVMSWWRVMP